MRFLYGLYRMRAFAPAPDVEFPVPVFPVSELPFVPEDELPDGISPSSRTVALRKDGPMRTARTSYSFSF